MIPLYLFIISALQNSLINSVYNKYSLSQSQTHRMGLRVANWVLLVSPVLSEDARLVTHACQPCQPASTQLPRMSALSDCLQSQLQNARVSRLNPAFLSLPLIRISSHHPETKFRIALNVSEGSPFVNISAF